MQLLPKLPDGMLDLTALADGAGLEHLSPRARHALDSLMTRTRDALAERRFAAIVVDDVGTGMFPVLFGAGLVGADGRFGTDDDPYVRLPGPMLTEPGAIRPLLGYDVCNPYALAARR